MLSTEGFPLVIRYEGGHLAVYLSGAILTGAKTVGVFSTLLDVKGASERG